MLGLFDIDGPLFTLLNRIASMFILNMLFLISCLPIFTIGAAVTALTRVSINSISDAHLSVTKEYIKVFKENFKDSTALFFIDILIVLLFMLTFYYIGGLHLFIKVLLLLIGGTMLLYLLYPLVLQGVFKNSLKRTMKNSLIFSLKYVAESILMFIEGLVILILLPLFIPKSILLVGCFGFAAMAYLQAFTYKKIFSDFIE